MGLTVLRTVPKLLHTFVLILIGILLIETLLILPSWRPDTHFDLFTADSAQAPTHEVDWSRFAYTQYATNTAYLCNSVMIFETLHRLQSKADRVMMYPMHYSLNENDDNGTTSRLLQKARDEYNVTLVPIKVHSSASGDATWADSFTKLLAFNQTQYDRVLSLDSDATLLKHMDELFLMPPCPLAMPRAYWLNSNVMTSALMLVTPSESEFARVMNATQSSDDSTYDMELVNDLYGDSALLLPHDPYILLTGEFRSRDHSKYLSGTNSNKTWNPDKVLKEAKFLHFSDWPVPKPWNDPPTYLLDEKKPSCHLNATSGEFDDCRDRQYWLEFYTDFNKRRVEICGADL